MLTERVENLALQDPRTRRSWSIKATGHSLRMQVALTDATAPADDWEEEPEPATLLSLLVSCTTCAQMEESVEFGLLIWHGGEDPETKPIFGVCCLQGLPLLGSGRQVPDTARQFSCSNYALKLLSFHDMQQALAC